MAYNFEQVSLFFDNRLRQQLQSNFNIWIKAQVRVGKPLLEECGFATGLDADEDDGLHNHSMRLSILKHDSCHSEEHAVFPSNLQWKASRCFSNP